ncbi:MAG: TetR/AcrR family transcriptional regulator [Gemmatimonadetes bacterium]|jgi:AcrR family transcriptional regulator|nr:TetR/AcrR family transcriptional regulator [Gemmatimonadota bacterium]
MPRKKLDEERIPQILDAFERCIVKYGIMGTSLERVAQEAEISRTTIHHYIGGRKDLIRATYKRFADTWLEGIDRLADVDIDDLSDYMMSGWQEELGHRLVVMDELMKAVSLDPETLSAVSEVLAYLFQSEAVHFQHLYPTASLERCRDAGKMLYALGFGMFRLSEYTELPSDEVARSSMKGILESLLNDAIDD